MGDGCHRYFLVNVDERVFNESTRLAIGGHAGGEPIITVAIKSSRRVSRLVDFSWALCER